jgi:HK97 family phage major capsid protein
LEIIADAPKSSVVLTYGRRIAMSTRDSSIPALSAFPVAYWVNPADTGLKQTSEFALTPKTLTAEELAVIVVIPISVEEDAGVDLWAVARPLLAEALGSTLDQTVLNGTNAPASFADANIIAKAITAGNAVVYDPAEAAQGASDLLGVLEADEFNASAVVAKSILAGAARVNLMTDISGGMAQNNWWGVPVEYRNWGNPATTIAIAGDWTKAVVGVRRDIRFEMFSEGVIQDGAGAIQFNLLQQDLRAIRATFRVAFGVVIPQGASAPADRYPFAVLNTA